MAPPERPRPFRRPGRRGPDRAGAAAPRPQRTFLPAGATPMMTSRLRSLVLGAVALAVAASPAAAQAWGGAGGSGVDPYGHPWQITAGSPLAWGIPGLGFGTLTWAGPTLSSFEIAFNGGSLIATNVDPDSFTATRMRNVSETTFWDVLLAADRRSVLFTAPTGAEITTGDEFFVNVVFETADRPTSFTATYNVTAVPEPSTYVLMATGLLAIGGAAARRRR